MGALLLPFIFQWACAFELALGNQASPQAQLSLDCKESAYGRSLNPQLLLDELQRELWEMQYPLSSPTLLGMRHETATHAGGSTFFFFNKSYFRVKDNCIDCESRETKWFWKRSPFILPSAVTVIYDTCEKRWPVSGKARAPWHDWGLHPLHVYPISMWYLEQSE